MLVSFSNSCCNEVVVVAVVDSDHVFADLAAVFSLETLCIITVG